jgi:hypothetical protein
MDPIITLEKKPESSLIFIVTLSLASFVLYTILYYVMGQNPLLPLKFDLPTYIMCSSNDKQGLSHANSFLHWDLVFCPEFLF